MFCDDCSSLHVRVMRSQARQMCISTWLTAPCLVAVDPLVAAFAISVFTSRGRTAACRLALCVQLLLHGIVPWSSGLSSRAALAESDAITASCVYSCAAAQSYIDISVSPDVLLVRAATCGRHRALGQRPVEQLRARGRGCHRDSRRVRLHGAAARRGGVHVRLRAARGRGQRGHGPGHLGHGPARCAGPIQGLSRHAPVNVRRRVLNTCDHRRRRCCMCFRPHSRCLMYRSVVCSIQTVAVTVYLLVQVKRR